MTKSKQSNKELILSDFNTRKEFLQQFCQKTERLIKELLIENSISIHQISVRVKAEDSLSRKIDKKGDKYKILSDITDIIGIRIIVYLENEVDIVASILDKEFKVDRENSIDKRNLKIDSFGYKSLHYVIGYNDERCALTEYKKYADFKAEIQIRSVLQHAWAEIEHDIGYKGDKEIPEQYKRTFHRVAALLETADLEFVRLKKELREYEKELPKEIEKRPDTVRIDKASLKSYLYNSTLVKKIEASIIQNTGAPIEQEVDNCEFIISKFDFFKIETIKDLDDLLNSKKKIIIDFASFFINNSRIIPIGISVFYLFYILVLEEGESIDKINEYIAFGSKNLTTRKNFAKDLLDKYKIFKQQQTSK